MQHKISIIFVLISFFITATNVNAKDVSSEITVTNSGIILGCITRFEIYGGESKNILEDQNADEQKSANRLSLLVSIPYFENIRNAAWSVYPANQDWDAFYLQQVEQVKSLFKTNNVFTDTFSCVGSLMSYGVMYPPIGPNGPAPEQMKIIEEFYSQ